MATEHGRPAEADEAGEDVRHSRVTRARASVMGSDAGPEKGAPTTPPDSDGPSRHARAHDAPDERPATAPTSTAAAALLAETDRLLAGLQSRAESRATDWRRCIELSPELGAALDDELANGSPERRQVLASLIERAAADRTYVLALTFTLEDRHRSRRRSGPKAKLERHPRSRDLPRCGARARSRGGAPCRAPVVCRRDALGRLVLADRCRLHGGLSTGPKTPEGRERCMQAARARWERWRAERAAANRSEETKGTMGDEATADRG